MIYNLGNGIDQSLNSNKSEDPARPNSEQIKSISRSTIREMARLGA
jgi:hypothetical protein